MARLEHFAARDALDIEGVGGVLAEVLVERGVVKNPLDLFTLTPEALATVVMRQSTTGKDVLLGEKNARKIFQALERARTLPLHRWIFAFGIPRIGATVAEQVASCHTRLSDIPHSELLQQTVRAGNLERNILDQIPATFSPFTAATSAAPTSSASCPVKYEAARALIEFFAGEHGHNLLRRMEELGIRPVASTATAAPSGPLTGQSFVITGTLHMPRAEMESRIKAAGGKVADAVTKKTTFLVVGEDPGGTKYRKAQELGIPLLAEPEILARIPPMPQPV